jgi:hypothetical protein
MPRHVKTCPACAQQIHDDAAVCPHCGRVVATAIPPMIPDPPAPADARDLPLQYTHSGRRYLLGYGEDFFGIWDRERPDRPVSRYPRTDDGWRSAWLAFVAEEPFSAEVGIGATGVAPTGPAGPAMNVPPEAIAHPRPRRVSGAWWLLPILMGWLGGLIAWLVNKDVDPQRARAMLITGIAISAVLLVLLLATSGPAPAT